MGREDLMKNIRLVQTNRKALVYQITILVLLDITLMMKSSPVGQERESEAIVDTGSLKVYR